MQHTPQPGFIPLRDPRTLKVVCHFNPQTREIIVIQRGDERRTVLPNVRVIIEEELTPRTR